MPAAHAATTSTTAFMERLEQSESLGRAADEMAKPMGALLGDGPVSDALRGRPLGHALHPVLARVHAGERTQRVGIAHAGLNATAAMASALSYLARRRGWSPAAAALTGVAAAALSAGGVLGGHMSLVRKYASLDQPSDSEGVTRGGFEAA